MQKIDREILNRAIEGLPDQFSLEELVDCLILLNKIDKGMRDSKNGRVLSEAEAKSQMEGWIKKIISDDRNLLSRLSD